MIRSIAEALPAGFYDRPVVEVAEDLLGCIVSFGEGRGVIVETEAYHESEPACHAFVGLTPRTETLFGEPGYAYVYRSYGIHALLNAVCEPQGVGAAVLIRALEPLRGIEQMRVRRGTADRRAGGRGDGRPSEERTARRIEPDTVPGAMRDADLCSGPGKLTQALGVDLSENGGDLRTGRVTICTRADGWERAAGGGRPARWHHQGSGLAMALLRGRQPPRVPAASYGLALTPPVASELAPPPLGAGEFSAGLGAAGVDGEEGAGAAGGAGEGGEEPCSAPPPPVLGLEWPECRSAAPSSPDCEAPEEPLDGALASSEVLVVDCPCLPAARAAAVAAACSARVLSMCRAEIMKSCQISAGNVPPSTGPPSNWVVIGTRPFG